jgi:hypothetical protein
MPCLSSPIHPVPICVLQAAYKAQADVVLQAQANLNDTQKMVTELFDSKINGFAATPIRFYYSSSNGLLRTLSTMQPSMLR